MYTFTLIKTTWVIFSLLPSSFSSVHMHQKKNRPQITPRFSLRLSVRIPRNDSVPPDGFSSLFVMSVRCCVCFFSSLSSIQRAFSALAFVAEMCISHRITTAPNCAQIVPRPSSDPFPRTRQGRENPLKFSTFFRAGKRLRFFYIPLLWIRAVG